MTGSKTSSAKSSHARLRPVLGLFSAICLVIGCVIGSGVFLKPSQIAVATQGHVGLILTLWVALGVVNLCGALALAELAAMFPQAGGSYVFLREAYGPLWAFSWAWAEFWVIRSGSIATLAAAMSVALAQSVERAGFAPWGAFEKGLVSVVSIAALAATNIVGTRWAGAVQNFTTVIKIAFVAFLAILPFLAIRSEPIHFEQLWPATLGEGLLAGIGGAISGIMWAYDGWANLPSMAEEVRDPCRNVPPR